MPEAGSVKNAVVIRAAFLLDGKCRADQMKDDKGKGGKMPYRVQEGDIKGWSVSRRDVAHFVVEDVLAEWSKWEGKCVSIAY